MPIKLGSKEDSSALSFSWSMSHFGQSIIFISCPSCSSTAAKYAKPSGGIRMWWELSFRSGVFTIATLAFFFIFYSLSW
jgi:hypothetical protein